MGLQHDGLELAGFLPSQRMALARLELEAGARNWQDIAHEQRCTASYHEGLAVALANCEAPTGLIRSAWEAGEQCQRSARMATELAQRLDIELPCAEYRAGNADESVNELCAKSDLLTLLDEIIVTGCVGYTLAAFELEILAARSEDTDAAWVLGQLAHGTTAQAELAWSTCTWMLRRWPELRDHARGYFASAVESSSEGLLSLLPRLGLISPLERGALLERARAETVEPVAASLSGGVASARHVETWLEERRY